MTPPPNPSPTPPPGAATAPEGSLVPYTGSQVPALYSPALRPAVSPYRRYLIFLGRRWWMVLLTLMLFGGLAAAYALWWPAKYATSSFMWAAGRAGLQLREGITTPEDNLTFAGTQIELLQSSMMLGRTYNKVHDTLKISFPTNSEGQPQIPSVKVIQIPKSAVLQLTAKGAPETAVIAFLNVMMDEFLAYKKEVRQASSGDTYNSVSEQTLKQEAELKTEQENLTAYMMTNNVAVAEERAKAASMYLTQLLAQESELKLQYQLLENLIEEGPASGGVPTNSLASLPDLRQMAGVVVPSAGPQPEFLQAQQELEKWKIMRQRLSKNLRPEHPKIVKIDEQIAQSERLVEFLNHQSRDQLANLKQTTKLKMERVQETIHEWEGIIDQASAHIAEYERLKLRVSRLLELHDHMLTLLQTVDVGKSLDQESITILERASRTTDAKRTPLVAAFLLVLGLGAGLGLVYLTEKIDDRVMSSEELASRFDEWVVGQIPEVPRQRKRKTPALLALDDDRHGFIESHRSIRSALWFAMSREQRPKVILVTSAVPGEGKTTVAANLARTMAFAGSRVLLIDADLRRGSLHELFELPAEPGLSDLLAREGDLPFYLAPTAVPNLTLMPRGKIADNSGELLLNATCDRLLARVRKEFDCVIVDSIPIFAADDTTSLAPKVDGVLFVVRNSFTSADSARHALELLYERQARILGIVFNRANTDSKSYRYYKYGKVYGPAGKSA